MFSNKDSSTPFRFISGIGTLFSSAAISVVESNIQELKNEEYYRGNYNISLQINQYDSNRSRLVDVYDQDMVVEEIRHFYPKMAECNIWELSYIAIAQKMMEDETSFKYLISDKYSFLGNVKRFVKDEFKK